MSLYYSFTYAYLTYCNQVWGSVYKTNLCRLSILQNKAMRIICQTLGKCWSFVHQDWYHEVYRHQLILIGRFMHRCCNGNAPEIFVSYFQQNCDVHHYDTRTAQHFHIPQVKFDLAKTGIRYRGAVVWNVILSDNTNTNVSEALIKKVLKRLLSVGGLY